MPANDEIAFDILRSIRRILRKAADHSRQLARDSGLTVPQLLCLRAIAQLKDAEVTVASVSQAVHLSSPTVSRILDRLEQAGYIVRERRSSDRRKVCLSLSELGRQRADTLPPPLQEQFLARVQGLDQQERLSLLRSLERIVEMMEASDLDAAPVLDFGEDLRGPTHP